MKSRTLRASGYFCGLENNLTNTVISSGPYKGRESEYSESITGEGDIASLLFRTFKLADGADINSFRKACDMAMTGDGNGPSKILTVHSSSLLALLCFFSVSPERPLTIGGDKYTEVMFEVKNVVIKKDRRMPSNIDVVLVSKSGDGEVRKLLFLESKFTEYVGHGRVQLASKYHPFYNILKERIRDFKFHISDYDIRHKDGSISTVFGLWSAEGQYLGGIKQAFSHLLGIATGPAKDSYVHRKPYAGYYRQAEDCEFATIVHDWNPAEFNRYRGLYADTFKSENLSVIKDALKKTVPDCGMVDRLKIHPEILTYKDIFKDFCLPGIIRMNYRL